MTFPEYSEGVAALPRESLEPDLGTAMPPPRRAALRKKQRRTQQPHKDSGDAHRQRVVPAVTAEQDDGGCYHPRRGSDGEHGARVRETTGPRCDDLGWVHELQISSFRLQ